MTTDQNSNKWLPRHQIWSKEKSMNTNNLVRTKRKVRTLVQAIFKGEVAARALSPRINSGKASLSACGPAAKATNDANKCQDIWNQIYIVCILIYSMYIVCISDQSMVVAYIYAFLQLIHSSFNWWQIPLVYLLHIHTLSKIKTITNQLSSVVK